MADGAGPVAHGMDPPDGADAAPDEVEASRAPLLSHLTELRWRLIVMLACVAAAFVVLFVPPVSYPLFNTLLDPFTERYAEAFEEEPELFAGLLELFFVQMKLAFFGALMVAFPVISWQVYAFVAPGLYRRERRAVLPYLVAMPVLFAAGILLVHQLIMPFVMDFAILLNERANARTDADINMLVKAQEYLKLSVALMIGFGFAFQLPVVLTLLGKAGLVTPEWLAKNRRFAVCGIFLVAAFLTPPDPFSQLALGLTIFGLYELSILCVRMVTREERRGRVSP